MAGRVTGRVTGEGLDRSRSEYGGMQRYEQALPSTRELQLIQALGDRAAVGSACAASVTGPDQVTSGYKPAIDAVLRALRGRIK